MDERAELIPGRRSRSHNIPGTPFTPCELFGALLFVLMVVVPVFSSWFVVPPGEIGVVVTLGQVSSFGQGLHWRIPYASHLVMLSAKTQKLDEQNNVPTKEGLSVQLDTAILFRLDASKAGELYSRIGPDYVNVVIAPEAASATRGLTSESEAKELYTSGRNAIQDALKQELKETLGPRGIIIEDVLLKDIHLPEQLTHAIEAKVKAEQDSQRMQFVLAKEEQEAKRKAIEAQGIADFQRIVSSGISDELLRWKGVEATEKLAESCNSKLVIMGNGRDGLPVILSAADDGIAAQTSSNTNNKQNP
ncbi:Prohibitin-2 [Seminavis robusta]|uniref:Prohibitin n=1 Tax=Seminavis robusta TaxID=568900 RepID=A0A9N8EMY4_9STRA|nr:Prohibitin-2 [Seminavis robusta]|eukprot:Sro1360_g266090.1 Prohibitin-2 (305) ;mRNA; r:17207-18279